MEGDLEFRKFGFQTIGLLELHSNCLNCLKSELATPHLKQHLNTTIIIALQGDGGWDIKK